MKRLLLAALLVVAPFEKGEAQTYQFFGCDGANRSCHLMRFERLGTVSAFGNLSNQFDQFRFSGHSTFSAPGVFERYQGWNASPFDYTIGPPLNADIFYGPGPCSWADPLGYLASGGTPCPADFEWGGLGNGGQLYQAVGWQPTYAEVTVGFAGDASLTTIPLSAVPEPSTYVLFGAGLAVVIVASRRRSRSSRLMHRNLA